MYGVGGDTFSNFLPVRDFVKEDKVASIVFCLPSLCIWTLCLYLWLIFTFCGFVWRSTPRRVLSDFHSLHFLLILGFFFYSALIFLEIKAARVGSLSVGRK